MSTTEEELTEIEEIVDGAETMPQRDRRGEDSSYAVFIPNTDEGAQLLKPRSQTTAREIGRAHV